MPRKPLTASNGPSGRPPPTQVRSQERYEAILLAAETEIGEVGFEELTITRIADRAGITSTSIYRYFESVEEILAVLTARVIEQLEREIQPLVSESVTTQALIEAFATALRQAWAA
jgi:AcrR family transcriptional regulator